MTKDLVLPNDYPPELLRLRAIERLDSELESAVMAKTSGPIRISGLLIGAVVVAGYLDIVGGAFLSGAARDLYTFAQLAMMAGIVASLGQAFLVGRRMQNAHDLRVAAVRRGEIDPLTILNAGLEDLQSRAACRPVEPKEIVAESLRDEAREALALRALQASLDQASQQAVAAPALAETAVTAPDSKSRRISL